MSGLWQHNNKKENIIQINHRFLAFVLVAISMFCLFALNKLRKYPYNQITKQNTYFLTAITAGLWLISTWLYREGGYYNDSELSYLFNFILPCTVVYLAMIYAIFPLTLNLMLKRDFRYASVPIIYIVIISISYCGLLAYSKPWKSADYKIKDSDLIDITDNAFRDKTCRI